MLMPPEPSGQRAYRRIVGWELSQTKNAGLMPGKGAATEVVALGISIHDAELDGSGIGLTPGNYRGKRTYRTVAKPELEQKSYFRRTCP
jgi:hypothetical protein